MERGTILIIEDNPDIREGIRILLQSEGYVVVEAADGAAGLRLLDGRIALVILDIMMPGLSGIETCKLIRDKSTVPVLFLLPNHRKWTNCRALG